MPCSQGMQQVEGMRCISSKRLSICRHKYESHRNTAAMHLILMDWKGV